MTDLQTQLRDYTDHIVERVELEEVLERSVSGVSLPVAHTRRRGWVVALAVAVAVFIAVGAVPLLLRLSGGSEQPVVSRETPGDPLLSIAKTEVPPFQATVMFDDGSEAILYYNTDEFRLEVVAGRPQVALGVELQGPGSFVVWDGEQLGVYMSEEDVFEVNAIDHDFEPLRHFDWHAPDPNWEELCRATTYTVLADELMDEATVRRIRCQGTLDTWDLWVSPETGLVLKLQSSRPGRPGWPEDFEVTSLVYQPIFTTATFAVVHPLDLPPAVDVERLPLLNLERGFEAPIFSGPLLGGGSFDLQELRGRPVLVLLWADWCPPCERSLPAFQELSEQWSDQVAFVSVLTMESTPEIATEIIEEGGFTFPVVIDLTDQLWNAEGIPTFVLLDSDGNAVDAINGWAAVGEPIEPYVAGLNELLQREDSP